MSPRRAIQRTDLYAKQGGFPIFCKQLIIYTLPHLHKTIAI